MRAETTCTAPGLGRRRAGHRRRHQVQQAGAAVHAALAKLAPHDRLVLTLFYLEGCAVAEIARLTGWSQTMVKVQAFRARNRLKKLLAEAENER